MSTSPLDLFSGIPGMLGVWLVHGGRLLGHPPTGADSDTLREAVPALTRLWETQAPETTIHRLSLSWGETQALLARMGEVVVVVIHRPEVDLLMLSDRLEARRGQLQELAEELSRQPELAPPPALPTPATSHREVAPALPGPSLKEISADLERILAALTRRIGPAASVLLDDMLGRWLKQGPPSPERLGELVDPLGFELPNEHERSTFLADVQTRRSP